MTPFRDFSASGSKAADNGADITKAPSHPILSITVSITRRPPKALFVAIVVSTKPNQHRAAEMMPARTVNMFICKRMP